MNNVIFKHGSQSMYDTLASKNSDALYFIEDTRRIYKGDTLLSSNDAVFVSELPEYSKSESDKLYVLLNSSGVRLYVKNSETLQEITSLIQSGAINDINMFGDMLIKSDQTFKSDDEHIPTTATVDNAIESMHSSILENFKSAVVNVSSRRASDDSGTILTFTDKSGSSKNVTINDLFLSNSTYNPSTHILALYIKGQSDPVNIDLSELVPQSVDTSKVALARSITATVDVGNVKKGDKLSVDTISDVQKLFEKLLSQDSNPTTTQPYASISLANAGAKEVGSKFTPSYTATLNPGTYSNNAEGAQPTGVTATSYAVTDTAGHTSSTAKGTFDEITVSDTTNYKVTVKICHSAGEVPTTFLGEPYATGQIKADTTGKSATSVAVTGYRQGFYGALASKSDEVTSTLVRSLANKTNKKVAKNQKYTLSIPAGTLRIIIAYDAAVGSIASITSDEQFGSEIKDSFVLNTVSVLDANNANGKNYNVYVKDLASAQANATKYQITI